VDRSASLLTFFANTGQGALERLSYNNYDSCNAVYRIPRQFTNLSSLPFTPVFNAKATFVGQNVSTTTHASAYPNGGTYLAATAVTLLPQTVDGMVTAVGSDGAFTTHTTSLASYDLVPDLVLEGGEVGILNDPSAVVVYADSNTQLVGTATPPQGSAVRFRGLLLEDNGTLRMDCDQINPGVTE
jgi:hypothetical protein